MRATIPVVRCDHCQADCDITTPSAIIDVTLPGMRPTRFSGEGCPDCSAKFAQALTELLSEYLNEERGTKAKAKTPQAPKAVEVPSQRKQQQMADIDKDGWTLEQRTCPIRGCGKTSVSRGGLGQHLNKDHGTTLAEQGMQETTEERAERFARIGRA